MQPAQSVARPIQEPEGLGSISGPATYFRFSFRCFKDVCQLLAKISVLVLVNRFEGLYLPMSSVVRLTDRGRKNKSGVQE